MVHVFPHWNWPGKVGQKILIRGYGNCEEVELFVNGKSLGRKNAEPFEYFEWEVVYHPGSLELSTGIARCWCSPAKPQERYA